MKKVIAGVFIAFAFASGSLLLAAYQPQNLGWVNISISSGTTAEIRALVPATVGQMKFCTNCITNGAQGTVCVSTGTTLDAFVLSTGTVCK